MCAYNIENQSYRKESEDSHKLNMSKNKITEQGSDRRKRNTIDFTLRL